MTEKKKEKKRWSKTTKRTYEYGDLGKNGLDHIVIELHVAV